MKTLVLTLFALFLFAAPAFAGALLLKDAAGAPTDFPVVTNGRAAEILVDEGDAEVVRIAAGLLAGDIERVSGVRPAVAAALSGKTAPVIIIGTLERSAPIADLVKRGKLDAAGIRGKWESFMIATVADPFPGVPAALVIAGSDRRGAAYGALTVSETIGVSPWEWWADVPPAPRKHLVVAAAAHRVGPPSVKYRGIFLNDEDWGLQEWAQRNYESGPGEVKDIGPKSYAKICELLLRLKANYLWPAMHNSTKAFNLYPENKVVADRYAIVMGSSHCEPLLRNNVGEWDPKVRGSWNYQTNRDGVLGYWEERVKESGRYENSFTVGMRGVHDSAMPFKGTLDEKIALMERIISDQRQLLTKYVNPKIEDVSQVFIPYKEVLTIYQRGLKVPDDVTLVWPDDNHGYIRRLSTPEERKRAGGAGVYYHLSYWGGPEDYLWLSTTPIALIWEEMHKAYEHGARTLWVVNVGDIKPAELGMEFFLRMAWDITAWKENAQPAFLADWAARTFGPAHAAGIAAILDEYYRLNYAARPEHMLQVKFTNNYGEIATRLERFATLVAKTDALFGQIPAAQRDAFFQLVVYPVRGSALMNEKHLATDPAKAQAAHDRIQAETRFYNEQVANGKWKHMMSAKPRNRPVFQPVAERTTSTSAAGAPALPATPAGPDDFVCFEAERPARATAGGGAAWKTISGLGRSGDSIALLPTTEVVPPTAALEYDFTAAKDGAAKVLVYAVPTHAIHDGKRLRYAVSIDGQPPQEVDLETAELSVPWRENVLRAAAIGTTGHAIKAGRRTLTIRPLDPGMVFDKIVVDFGGLQPTHLGPPSN